MPRPRAPGLALALVVTLALPAVAVELPVAVTETPDRVRLRVSVPDAEQIEPGSVEIQLAGRDVTIVARSRSGRRLRSRPLRLAGPASEDGVTANYENDRTLVVTLPKIQAPRP